MAPRSQSLPVNGPYPLVTQPVLQLVDFSSEQTGNKDISIEDGAIKIEHPDGSVTIDLNPQAPKVLDESEKEFSRNLALHMDSADLAEMASTLLEGIRRDEESRKDWLETRALGIALLGLKLERPRADTGSSTAPLEGMSTVRHPLLLEATVAFQSTARAELLPASGPVKVRNDSTVPPREMLEATTAIQDLSDSLSGKDDLAQALEKDLNHYLTYIATEYVPDTDRMLFYVGFGGDGFKKIYNCPLRRRPVSESIDAENLIVSDAATDLRNAGRVTHRIKMRPSILRRMQIMGVYRDVALSEPTVVQENAVEKKLQEISGVSNTNKLPEDRDYEVYETYCELDLDRFAPKKFKGKCLPLPYRVTLERESRQILDVRRNWREDDDQCLAKNFFVQFPFVRGLGFYGLGYIHLLGNTTNALTAAWRLTLDNGMFSNFPGFLYAKALGRQYTNQFRVAPGTGIGIDVGAQQRIQDAIMPLPYKETGPSFTNFMNHVEESGRRLGSTANIGVGEGKQDAPVGTTLALIEQATKVMDSAHKRLHAAQAEEFKLLKERFQEDPEAFWRHNKRPTREWKKDQFLAALESCELVPVADPNNPTSLHRIAKAMAIKTLQQGNPNLYDPLAVDMRIMRIVDIDPQGLFRPRPAPSPPDPRMVAIQEKAKAQQVQSQINLLQTKIKAATEMQRFQDKEKDRESRERIESMKQQLEQLKLMQQQIQHKNDEEKAYARMLHELNIKGELAAQNIRVQEIDANNQLFRDTVVEGMEQERKGQREDAEFAREDDRRRREADREDQQHQIKLDREREAHQQRMEHEREMHREKVKVARAMARAKPKSKGKSNG